jgi:deoxyribonucleoside regulator
MEDKRYLKKIKAAHLIYKEKLPLQLVAKMLGVSRPTLSKMIDEMFREEIVSIQIKDARNYQKLVELGYAISKRFGLKDAIVAEAPSCDIGDIMESIGSAGADYFQDFLRSSMILGTTGGRTIHALVSHLSGDPGISGIQVVTTTGGSLYANTKYHSNTVVQRLADIFSGSGHFIYAPTYADNREQRDTLNQNSQIIQTLELCKSADVVLTGIGDPQSAQNYLPRPTGQWFTQTPVDELAGAVNTLLLDKRGMPFPSPVSELYIGLGYEDLRKIKTVIGLAGGAQKHVAIKAALL